VIRIALPKGRNLEPVLGALAAGGLDLSSFDPGKLRQELVAGVELLLLKDWDLPLYVEQGIADVGFVGTDVLAELGADLLQPARLAAGHCRMCLIGTAAELPREGEQVRVATKYPAWSKRLLADRPWGVELVTLSGSVELGPLLQLADLAVDIVQTGRTLREHGLVEIAELAEIAPCVVMGKASFHHHRGELLELLERLDEAGVLS
jgi:ATP phosphoribosyltransferase